MIIIDLFGVFDGELLVIKQGVIGSFNDLQQRLNKKRPSKKLQQDSPVGIMIYDALKIDQEAMINQPLAQRREKLIGWFNQVNNPRFMLSQTLQANTEVNLRDLRQQATDSGHNAVEGLMLKRKDTHYVSGRPANQWLKWKRDPLTIDTVMMYAQRGHGKRSSFYSDFTFGVWKEDVLVPVGKAYSGFTDDELKQLDRWVRRNTIGRFGPVKEVEKLLVLEVAFDSAHYSKRHKSGIALRFPRIKRIRWDKPANEGDTVESVTRLIS